MIPKRRLSQTPARRWSAKRRFGASMSITQASSIARTRQPHRLIGEPGPLNGDTVFAAQCRARLAAMPPDFLDWLADAPPWPEGVPEILGPLQDR